MQYGETALYFACGHDAVDSQILVELVAAGADINEADTVSAKTRGSSDFTH